MPAPYNLSANATDIAEITVKIDEATNQIFGISLIIMIGLVIFLSMKDQPVVNSLATTVFLTFILASFMFAIGMLNLYIMGIMITLVALTTLVLFFSGGIR